MSAVHLDLGSCFRIYKRKPRMCTLTRGKFPVDVGQ